MDRRCSSCSFLILAILIGGYCTSGLAYASPRREVIKTIGEQGASLLIAAGNNNNNNNDDDDRAHDLLLATSNTIDDPSKLLLSKRSNIRIPRIGYSLYKTPADQVEDGVKLALDAGIRHFDVATMYGTTDIVGKTLRQQQTTAIDEPILSITHKVSNMEQSTNHRAVQNAVRRQLRLFLPRHVERIVLVHSPLTTRRVETYAALAELKSKGEIDAIGVAHFGVSALQELIDNDLPAPDLIQLELSPFHAHRDIVEWGRANDSTIGCAAWSKLSSVDGPQEGWQVVGKIASVHGCTKQQILIRWAVQKGYTCVPRSSSKFKVERQAIRENSWDATKQIVLSDAEMNILDGLDEQIPAGRLGVLDGWAESDIVDAQWDPTK